MSVCFTNKVTGSLLYQHKVDVCPSTSYFGSHTHGVYEMLYIINGDVTHIVEDKKYKLNSGDLVFIRPNMYHFIQIALMME
jgi:quercetin dioxygenase-like cupin family protein